MKTLRLIKYGDADEAFKLEELPDPEPRAGEVLIEVSHFGINYADVMARRGMYREAPPPPCTLGYEVTGRVIETGDEVKKFKTGDRVLAFTLFGGYADRAVADERTCVPLPDDVEASAGIALATQYCTAYYAAIYMANIQRGETVLIHACAGGVGLALLEIAKMKGCKAIGTAGSDRKIAFIKERGADHAINYQTSDFVREVRELTGAERPIDAAFDAVGGKVFSKTDKLMNYGSRHVLFGVASRSGKRNSLWVNLRMVYDFKFTHPLKYLLQSRSLMGLNMLRIAEIKPDVLGHMMTECIDLTQKGTFNPHVNRTFEASEIAEAHRLLEERKTTGKVVLKW